MKTLARFSIVLALGIATANAALTGVSQSFTGGNAPNVNPPQIEALPFGEEVWAYVDRTHELTSVRYDATGTLSTANTETLAGLPSYLIGLQYVANANANRTAGDINSPDSYTVSYTVDGPSRAYLLIDNRMNGSASNATSSSNTTDPDLGGSMSWVLADGWTRVNTGFMPNGQADYVGIDEGRTVGSPGERDHTGTGLVAGPGEGLNQFFAVYSLDIPEAGTFVTRGIRQTTGSGNMYVVAVAPIPEPSTLALCGLGALAGLLFLRRRR